MTRSPLTPEDIARRVGRSGMRVRKLLRQLYPDQAPGTGGLWQLTEEQVQAVLEYFAGRGSVMAPTSKGSAAPARHASAAIVDVGSPAEWDWEGNVQARLVEHLVREGWAITSVADVAARARADDIATSKGSRRLAVEVKGYPSRGYRDPRRANEIKPTNPTLQAKHWFAEALLKVLRRRGTGEALEVAMAFPEAARYRTLIAETEASLRTLGVGVYVVGPPDEDVELVLPHGLR